MLLGRLEDEIDDTVRAAVALRRKHFGRADQHRGVAVVAAGMHAAFVFRAMGKRVQLRQRQRVHVGAQPDHRSLPRPHAQAADHAGLGQAAMHVDAEAAERGGDRIGRPLLVEGELRVGVQIAPQCGDALMQFVEGMVVIHGGVSAVNGITASRRDRSQAAFKVSRARLTARSKIGSTGTMAASPRSSCRASAAGATDRARGECGLVNRRMPRSGLTHDRR